MGLRFASLLVAWAWLGAMGASAADAPAPPRLVGEVEEICQLTGETDRRTGSPTAARTISKFGLDATDLGYPVEHLDKLILLFGDSWPPRHPSEKLEDAIPGDAVGVVTRREPPSRDGKCLDMRILVEPGAPPTFAPATVLGPPEVHQGFFNVPSGGVSVGDRLFGFFWTDHCPSPRDLDPSPEAPLARPDASATCPETDERDSIGRGVIAVSDDDARTFRHAAPLPRGFVYATAVDARAQRGLAKAGESRIFVLGVPRYRASVPYLAEATRETLADPKTWRFFVGLDAAGEPKWVSHQDWTGGDAVSRDRWAPPTSSELFANESGTQACVGEFSITYNSPLGAWLLLYNCRGEIEARIARAPWGPWSDPSPILGRADGARCEFLMASGGCGDRRDFWANPSRKGVVTPGGFYAPFVLDRFTTASEGGAIIYWLVSTWNPYEVSVMRATLRAGD
jgi:hypothetical protein